MGHSDGPELRVGVLLPTREAAAGGDWTIGSSLDFAREAERLGFDSLWTGDSLLARPRLDPVVVLAAVATATTRITLGTAALTAALRHPLTGAHQIASLDRAAAGRLVVGLGAGFPVPETEEEFAAAGVPFTGRAGRLDETVLLWRRAWRGGGDTGTAPDDGTGAGPYDFTGRHCRAGGLDRLPRPATAGGPPLWLAGSDTPRVVARVARLYDGWLPFLPDPAAYARALGLIRRLAVEHGRPADAVVPGLYATVAIGPDRERARKQLDTYTRGYYGRPLERMAEFHAFGYGSARECAAWLGSYVRAGARHVVLRIGSLDPGAQRAQLAEAADVVVPALRAGT
ncbi:LLM class flavin-dependent oxidoreductase [Streptomyces poonensis]|uniref:N5,N10-methylene tetrahydromethanopterin reductase n=1 Tax=Streptomyces poonensis TaxID=68255 RepID=A0A918PZI1_9ACTN|nr:LLM class flavin-dependent oxidoreductase [Streptomyces poonensis]GGZ28402.1 N5,N10-methylene tetrahydromethanopterin reductase [Streptomyces poonensis]GLJ89830.1 N5,N10-methylene tetrahydromethanopterin reductase [Streptomyces poonensis]